MRDIARDLDPLTLGQFVRFAGAVQDFNPIHYDPDFAKKAGLPGPIAQGPLTYLVALDALVAANGAPALGGFAARFKAPVRPGAKLALTCSADGQVVLTADDAQALAGTATAAEAGRR